ncbi:MAG TPA: hypothetical protein VF209_01390, partial [Patescibacteria group bacterium]
MENTFPQNPQPQFTSETQVVPSTSSHTLKIAVVGLLILLPIVAAGGYYFGLSATKNNISSENPVVEASPSSEEGVVCTLDAKICPDGSSVGRTGPNCEFAECPVSSESKPVDWETLENNNLGFSFSYPNDLRVISRNQTAGNQQVLYELTRSSEEGGADFLTGTYLISYHPNTTAEDFYAKFNDSVYTSSNRTQILSNGLT